MFNDPLGIISTPQRNFKSEFESLAKALATAKKALEHYADVQQWRVIDDPDEPGGVLMIYDGELQDARYTTGDFVAKEALEDISDGKD